MPLFCSADAAAAAAAGFSVTPTASGITYSFAIFSSRVVCPDLSFRLDTGKQIREVG